MQRGGRKIKFNMDVAMALKFAMVLVLILVMVLQGFSWAYSSSNVNHKNYGGFADFNEGWTDKAGEYVNVPNVVEVPVGEKYIIENRLPKEFNDKFSIIFKSYYEDVRVYIDGEKIYEFTKSPNQRLLKGTPKNQNVINIPAGSAGKKIVIELSSQYKVYSVVIKGIMYCPSDSVNNAIIYKGMAKFVVAMAIVGCGLSTACIAILRKIKGVTYEGLFWYSIFLTFIGAFMISDHPALGLIMSAQLECSVLSLMTLSVFAIPFVYYFQHKQKGIVKSTLQIILCGHMTYVVVSAFLMMFGIIDMMTFKSVSMIIVLFELFFCLISNLMRRRDMVLTIFMFVLTVISFVLYHITSELSWAAYVEVVIYYIYIINNMLAETQKNDVEVKESQLKEKQAQDYLRVNQINMHFFYHVMFDTRSLILDDPKLAYQSLGDFSKYLRYKTDAISIKSGLVPFHDELKSIKAYCNLEHMMFPNKINVEYNIETDDFSIPVLTIQPMVENAIEHGLKPLPQGGTVTITVIEHKMCYEVVIKDNGVGFDIKNAGTEGHTSVSQQNIMDRLRNYGDNHMLIDSRSGEGTVVTFRFKKNLKEIYDEDDYS